MKLRARTRDLAIFALLFSAACTRADAHAEETPAAPSASATLSSAPSPSTTAEAPASSAAPAAAAPSIDPPLPILPAGKASVLADVGLTIAPPFPHRLEDRKTHWNLEDTSRKSGSVWVMRKMYRPDAPLGTVLPCADPKEGAPHREPDGSFTSRCKGSAADDGMWFARLVPTTSTTYETVQCQGSSKSPEKLKLIEATCRSIKKQ